MQTATSPSVKSFPPPRDKAKLADYLTEAAMLEHQFMCQYLYAAFSLKKYPDETCSAAQLEVVRRWASYIYMIARQEMEHLSIANSILTAIGSPPWFGHTNFPTQSRWYQSAALQQKNAGMTAQLKKAGIKPPQPCDFPFLLQAFNLSVARRFCCMESPTLEFVLEQDQKNVRDWCFEPGCGCVPKMAEPPRLAYSFVGDAHKSASLKSADKGVEPGTVQELYAAIANGLESLNAELGAQALFSGHQSGQSQILMEYDIYLFSICDLDTALAAIKLITSQGEGLDAPPGYESHYQNYYDIAVQYAAILAEDNKFEPSLKLPLNPKFKPRATSLAGHAVKAFDDGYVAMLYMLAAYYANYSPAAYNQAPYLFQALEQSVFAPTMTMLIRSLAELITQLPPDKSGALAGPVFYLSDEALENLRNPTAPIFRDINFHVTNLDPVSKQLEEVIRHPDLPSELKPKFEYVHQNVWRIKGNLQYIYENGTYPKFVNLPNCPPDDGCD